MKTLTMLAIVAIPCFAIAQGAPRPSAPPGWFFDPAMTGGEHSLTFDDCRDCWPESLAPIRAYCSTEQQGLVVFLPGQGPRAERLRGQTIDMALAIDGTSFTLTARAEE